MPLIALTATADDQTREDVRQRLHIADAPVFSAGFDRPNIRYTVADKRSAPQQLEHFIAQHPTDSGIVYCLSRKRVEQVAGGAHLGSGPQERNWFVAAEFVRLRAGHSTVALLVTVERRSYNGSAQPPARADSALAARKARAASAVPSRGPETGLWSGRNSGRATTGGRALLSQN